MNKSVNAPLDMGNTISEWVWFGGATALLEGQGVCYNWDYGTAATVEPSRGNRVEVPTILNARFFAGVAARAYSAKTNGQFIEIYCPGSVCKVLSKANATIGAGILTCQAGGDDAGYFTYAGFQGEGSAVPLQTIDRSSTAGTVLAKLSAGEPSGLVEFLTATAGAIVCMVGGVTLFGVATIASDATFTLADGLIPGQKKAFSCTDTQTTSDIVVTVTSGLQMDGSTALATITLDGDEEECVVQWQGVNAAGALWVEQGAVGSVQG